MRKAVALLSMLAAAATPQTANAGCAPWCSPVSDLAPRWSADGTKLAFASGPGGVIVGVVVAKPDGSSRMSLPDIRSPQQLSHDFSRYALYTGDPAGGTDLSVAEVGGTSHTIARAAASSPRVVPAWSPDGTRVAFTGPDGRVSVVGADGSNPRGVLDGPADSVAWSPDGQRLAVGISGAAPGLWAVEVDGSNARMVFSSGAPLSEAWSPDSRTLAFVAAQPGRLPSNTLYVVTPEGTVRGLGLVAPSRAPDQFAAPSWAPDGRHVAYSTTFGISIFDSVGAGSFAVTEGSDPAWSPDGSTIAFRHSGPCFDRSGIAVVAPDGSSWRKLTNDCRIFGTEGPDEISGTGLDDVIFGAGGNDRLDGSAGYDTIYGGDGNDVLIGGPGIDTIYGGPGADRLEGNLIFGGSGRDRITVTGDYPAYVYALDDERDVISCGRSRRDVVYVDPRDRVGRSCERIFRR